MLRLTVLLAAVALAASRLGLIAHELVGHGGAALACGGHVTGVKLFWFGGGWLTSWRPTHGEAASVFIASAGIGVELLVALALWLGVRGDALGRRILRGVGAALVVHATWYLAVGTFNGFGDGAVLYRALGSAHIPVAVIAGAVTCLATYLGARAIVGPLASTLPRHRIVGFGVAALLAGGFHAALTLGELEIRRDATYARVMESERDRRIAIELSTWQKSRGERVAPEAVRVERARLERADRPFPFIPLLAIATVLALVAGIVRTRRGREEPIARGLVVRAVVLAAGSIAAVIVLDLLLPG